MRPETPSWIEVDGDALHDNITALRRELHPARMAMVVKADAYGHGVSATVPIAEAAGVDEFAVFSVHEASHVLDAARTRHIQIMGHVGNRWDWVAEQGIEPWIGDVALWPEAQAAAANADVPLRIHLEVETGMHRTGLIPDNVLHVIEEAADDPHVEVRGLCTHLAGAEDRRNAERIADQMACFQSVQDAIVDAGHALPLRHVASSSAALVDPELRFDMVRVGIASYGHWPTPEVRRRYHEAGKQLGLRRVMTWRSRIMAIQHVPAGDCIGYGTSYQASQDMTIAIVPVGYGDGLMRGLSNWGQVLVEGTRCPIVGPVNMNMVQIDVSHLPDVAPGNDVVLIGRQGDEEIGVHSFAETQELINYELMARISPDLPRLVVGTRGQSGAPREPGLTDIHLDPAAHADLHGH